MLCEIYFWGNFWVLYLFLTILAVILTFTASTVLFYHFYVKVTFEKWQYKSNPNFPEPKKVRSEILQMLKGCYSSTILPALSIYLSTKGYSKAYCGVGEYGWGYLVLQFFIFWLGSDFFEFYYHRLGHITKFGWSQHKWHHLFSNPSPFAVIADEYFDQFMRAAPLLLFTLFMPTNIDLLFFEFAIFFYGYGLYLHWGYEVPWLDAHHPYINTAFQHYLHHAKSTQEKPYHTGFYFKIWDQLFNSMWTSECFCAKCEREKGKRTLEKFKKVTLPDYSVLLKWNFWFNNQINWDDTNENVGENQNKEVKGQ